MDYFEALIHRAACAATRAAAACRVWENGGDPDPVADTAWEANEAISEAFAELAGIDPALAIDTYPESRVGRLATAAKILILAGTDEGGRSAELEMAAQLLKMAARS